MNSLTYLSIGQRTFELLNISSQWKNKEGHPITYKQAICKGCIFYDSVCNDYKSYNIKIPKKRCWLLNRIRFLDLPDFVLKRYEIHYEILILSNSLEKSNHYLERKIIKKRIFFLYTLKKDFKDLNRKRILDYAYSKDILNETLLRIVDFFYSQKNFKTIDQFL